MVAACRPVFHLLRRPASSWRTRRPYILKRAKAAPHNYLFLNTRTGADQPLPAAGLAGPLRGPNYLTLTVGRSAQDGEQRSCCVCVLPAVPGPADSRHFARAEDHAGTRLLSRSHAHPPARGAFSRSVQVTQELQLGLPEDARRAMARARQHSFETATSSSYLRIDLAHNAALVQQATTQLVQAQSQQAAGSAASNAEDVQAQSAA